MRRGRRRGEQQRMGWWGASPQRRWGAAAVAKKGRRTTPSRCARATRVGQRHSSAGDVTRGSPYNTDGKATTRHRLNSISLEFDHPRRQLCSRFRPELLCCVSAGLVLQRFCAPFASPIHSRRAVSLATPVHMAAAAGGAALLCTALPCLGTAASWACCCASSLCCSLSSCFGCKSPGPRMSKVIYVVIFGLSALLAVRGGAGRGNRRAALRVNPV